MRRLALPVLLLSVLSASAIAKIEPARSSPNQAPVVSTTPLRVLASDSSGVTLEWLSPEPQMEPAADGYVSVRFDGSAPTGRTGEPELPAYRAMLGAPLDASVTVTVSSGAPRDLGTARVAPVPTPRVVRDASDVRRIEPRYAADPATYRRSDFLPTALAATVVDGMMRDRRIVQVEIRPVQYQPSTSRLRYYPRLSVRVDFASGVAQSPANAPTTRASEAADISDLFARSLLNDDASRNWRQPRRAALSAAPALDAVETTAIKVYTSKEGVYRVTGRMLRSAGLDLGAAPPDRLRLTFLGAELPIYVRGEADGRLDADDYVEFYATRPTTPHSRYNVYRLAIGAKRGMRVAETEGAPRNSLATLVPSFRSKVHLEENLLHSILQHVQPDDVTPNDPHAWFEARDHWFWFGVKNTAEKNEVSQPFPLFDVAKTFDPSRVDFLLQGQTPVVHDALLHVNETKIARINEWDKQTERRVGRSLPSDVLTDATIGTNVIRLARVDTNEDDDKDDYPYHFYVNWLEIEYTRLFRAVAESLAFSTPPSDKPLDVRRRQTLEYAVSAFVDKDISVYETDGSALLARFRNVEVEPEPLTPESRNRLRRYQEILGSVERSPATLYTARFQVDDTHDARYVAVSSAGVRQPERLALDAPSQLRDSANGADYIVIYHPWYVEAARTLVDWRTTTQGGGNRAVAVDVTDIYDEFSDGMATPDAIKAFLTHAFVNWQAPAFRNVVILADGTWDTLGVDAKRYPDAPEFMGYIPTHYVWSLFGQSAADHWFTTVSGIDSISDFFIGRLPVETPDQANAVVRKIIRYESEPPNGSWRRRIVSVADDDTTNSGDFLFRQSLNDISQNHTLLGYETTRIFLEDISNEVKANPEIYKDLSASKVARDRIANAFSDGAIIAQYAGHGGRQVWAHEIIFDNSGIAALRPTDRIPLLLVLSCFNGYFDAPVEPSMAESFLRLPNGGAIAMISATRLTFGSGNDALNRIIFDDIFQRNVRSLGEIAFMSKTRLLAEQGLSHLETMQQYMLFGDPATRLHLADYEVRPEVVERSVSPGGALRIASGRIFEPIYHRATDAKTFEPIADFTGRLVVTTRFVRRGTANVVEVAAETTVTNGVYPDVTLNVPEGIVAGRAQVEFYAESPTRLAVGGASYTVSDPVVDAAEPSVKDGRFALDTHVADDSAVASVRMEYYDRVKRAWTFVDLAPAPSRGPGWYRLGTAVELPPLGENIEYLIHVRDDDGNQTVSSVLSFTPNPLPDWRILPVDSRRTPSIAYSYDSSEGWRLVAHIENLNDAPTVIPLDVTFYAGNPDVDGDGKPDADARALGVATIPPSAWVKSDPLGASPDPASRLRVTETPLNSHWIAATTLQTTLPAGRHPIYVWLDIAGIETNGREEDANNNLDGVVISVNAALLSDGNATAQSLDRAIRVDFSGRAFPTPQVVSVDEIAPPTGQRSVTPFESLGSQGAYSVAPIEATLQAPASVSYLVDVTALRSDVARRVGLEDVPPAEMKPEETAVVENAVKTELSSAALYRWLPSVERWRRVDGSGVVKNASHSPAYELRPTEPKPMERSGYSMAVTLDPERVEIGEWIALFTGPVTYDLYLLAGSETMRKVADGVAALGSASATVPTGRETLPFLVIPSNAPTRKFGDVIKFETGTNATLGARLVVRNPREGNYGSGVVDVGVEAQANAGAIPEDLWLVLFVSHDTYEIRRRSTGIVAANGEPIRAKTGETWRDPATGFTVRIVVGDTRFESGDAFRFDSKTVVPVRGVTSSLGSFGVFRTTDKTPPVVEVSVVGQDFHDGDPVSPKPRFHAVIADDSGVDPKSVTLLLSRNGAEFQPVPEDQRTIRATPGTNQTLVEWTPELEPSDYDLRVEATDVEGLAAMKQMPFRVSASSDLRSAMNYPNPFRTQTDIAVEATGEMDTLNVTIYSLAGRVVRRLEHPPTAGFVRLRWDGRDVDGREVANGVYYARVRMTARGKTLTETIKLLKMK